MSGEVLTVAEVVREYGLGRTTVYDLFHAGKIPGYRIGSTIFLWRDKLEEMRRQPPPKAEVTPQPAKKPRSRAAESTRRLVYLSEPRPVHLSGPG